MGLHASVRRGTLKRIRSGIYHHTEVRVSLVQKILVLIKFQTVLTETIRK